MLEDALADLAGLMADCVDPWCVFGGAALYLHGQRHAAVADIDVLASSADCRRLAASRDIQNDADGGTDRFRSSIVLHPGPIAIPVEIMSDFEIFADGRWHRVDVGTVLRVRFGATAVPVAGLDDICAVLQLSGRKKDFDRLALIGREGRDDPPRAGANR